MDSKKIQALISELRAEIELREHALKSLQKLLIASNEVAVSDDMLQSDSVKPILFSASDSYVDLAVKIITANDYRPLPMNEIVKHIRLLRNEPSIERRSVEATLYRHMKMKGDMSRVIKTAPGIYGVRRYPREKDSVA